MIFIILFGILALVILIALFVTRKQKNVSVDNYRKSTEEAKIDTKNHSNSNNNSNLGL